MGRRSGISWAAAAVLPGLLMAVLLVPVRRAAARAQQPPLQPAQQYALPGRCLPQAKKASPPKLSIDSLDLEGASLPYGMSLAEFVAMLERSAGSGGQGWLDRLWNAVAGEWTDRGYTRAVVNIQTLADSVQGGVRHVSLRAHVDPGPQYRVAEVRMLDVNPSGDLHFPNQKLRDLIPLHPGQLMNAASLRQGVSALGRLYASHGYIGLQVTPDLHVDDQQYLVSVYVMLDPGPQYRVGKVTALGFEAEGLSMLKAHVKTGDVFDWNAVKHFYDRYQWLMPPGASVADDQIHRDAENGRVDLLLDFRACPKPAKAGLPGASAAR